MKKSSDDKKTIIKGSWLVPLGILAVLGKIAWDRKVRNNTDVLPGDK